MPNKREPLPRTITVLFFARLINAAGNFVFPFITMLLTVKLGWSAARTGSFMSVMFLVSGVGMLAGGKFGDLWGRKRVIVACQLGAAACFLGCVALGLSPAMPFVVAAANFLLNATWPVFNATVADLTPADQRKRAYALLYWGNNIGFSIGPLAAGFLFSSHPGLMFAGNATALIIVCTLFLMWVPETLPDAAKAEEARHSAEAAEEGGLVRALLRRPILLGFALSMAVMNFVYAQHMFSLPVFLGSRLGDAGAKVFGAAMTVNGLTVVAATGLVTWLLGRLKSLACMAVASSLYALGFGMLVLVAAPGLGISGPIVVYASTVVWTLGEIASATNANVFIASRSPLSHRSRMNSLVTWIGNSGSMLCPVLSGAWISGRGAQAIWPICAALGVIGAVLMLLLHSADRSAGPADRGGVQDQADRGGAQDQVDRGGAQDQADRGRTPAAEVAR
ncbi:MAG TPA: MFS transporter [Rectinemataceae bacterium]|nr:MFS transporter [Rectinemataceae bacterium]